MLLLVMKMDKSIQRKLKPSIIDDFTEIHIIKIIQFKDLCPSISLRLHNYDKKVTASKGKVFIPETCDLSFIMRPFRRKSVVQFFHKVKF